MNNMSVNDLIRKVDSVIKKHENDNVSPFDTNFVEILKYLENYILDQDNEIKDLKDKLKKWDEWDKADLKAKSEREIDISAFQEISGIRKDREYDEATKEAIGAFVRKCTDEEC